MARAKAVQSWELTWAALNLRLNELDSEPELERLLEAEIKAKRLYRAHRVYGRLSAVRRARELREIMRRAAA